MGLDMNDFVKYANEFKKLLPEFEKFLENWIKKQGNMVLADVKPNTPKDTGFAQNSWFLGDYQRQGKKAQIGINNSAEYISFLEYGTPGRPKWKYADGVHMLAKAMFKQEQKMPDDFDKALTSFLKQKGLL